MYIYDLIKYFAGNPEILVLFFSLIGLFFLWFGKKQIIGKIIVSIVFIFILIISNQYFAYYWASPLQNEYPPFTTKNLQYIKNKDCLKYIVVLGAGLKANYYYPVTDQITKTSLLRLVEGIRIHKLVPNSKLIFEGGGSPNFNTPLFMYRLALIMGVKEKDIIIPVLSHTTIQNTEISQNTVGSSPFILVTSAIHMPRAVMLYKSLGMQPIPAPVGFNSKKMLLENSNRFFPNSSVFSRLTAALHEYLGIIFSSVIDNNGKKQEVNSQKKTG